ncbi:MAG: S8 family serine peptidase [Candidatus Aminicenantes bacterium]|nr:S8 family serine peptidase [Candidatus Aminicenantes bacterium]
MKKHKRIFRLAVLGLVISGALALLLISQSTADSLSAASATIDDLYKHPKLESSLCRLIRIFRDQGFAVMKQTAEELGLDFDGDLLRVTVVTQNGRSGAAAGLAAPQLAQHITALGGRVESSFGSALQSLLPIDAILQLAENAQVRQIRLPLKPHACVITSEGVAKTGADSWQRLTSFHGQNPVKVAILDLGFTGYQELLGTELPASVTAKSFRSDQLLNTNVHGTACAEIVHDMAPDAELFLVNFNTDTEQHQAVSWLISQGVDIISYSIGWTNAGDGKGTGPITYDVDRAANAGIIWCSAAGNDADVHWEGTFSDPDSNGFHNFPDNDEYLELALPPHESVIVSMNWDDWGTWSGSDYSGSSNDYDLMFYYKSGGVWAHLWDSANLQNGAGYWPVEEDGVVNNTASTVTIGVRIYKHNATRNCKMEIFVWGVDGPIEYNVPAGSLTIPADSAHCVALGASDVNNDSYHYYSGRGPTHDGRIKPDFSAPSGTSGATYGNHNFYGTSSSTPHMAGAFALLKEKTPYSLANILDIITARALDLGDPGQDNKFGYGRLKLK